MKYIRFDDAGTSPSGKTRIWRVMSISQDVELGKILWHGTWRQYVFEPRGNTVWSDGCLWDVQGFLSAANREHANKRKATA